MVKGKEKGGAYEREKYSYVDVEVFQCLEKTTFMAWKNLRGDIDVFGFGVRDFNTGTKAWRIVVVG